MPKSSSTRITTVLFDLDGTLVDSIPDLAHCTNHMLKTLGREPLPVERISAFVGKGLERLIIRSLADDIQATDAPALQLQEAKAIFGAEYEAINGTYSALYPKVKEALEELHSMGLKLGIVTNKAMRFTPTLLKKKEILHYFNVVVGGDTCEFKKPHPEPLHYALNSLGSQPEHSVFVGDSMNDEQAAAAAGIPCLLLPYGYNEGQALVQPTDGALVDDLMDVVAWVRERR